MKDAGGTIIYVGKAKSLRKRLASYFSGARDLKTAFLVRNIQSIEVIVTASEYEAFLLENNLIKRHQPRYNIRLTDGKSYPVIKLTKDDYPRVYRTRRIVFDGSSYFGPYLHPSLIDSYLELIGRLFPLRKCRGKLKKREHPCLNYHIGRCSAPCAGLITQEEYLQRVEQVRKLLSGRTRELIADLQEKMMRASEETQYEQAATYRDQIQAVGNASESQKVVDFVGDDLDYIGCAGRDERLTFAVFQMRGGKLIGRELFEVRDYAETPEVVERFVVQYYGQIEHRPSTVYLPMSLETSSLRTMFGFEVKYPQRGKHAQTLALAQENAREAATRRSAADALLNGLGELQDALELTELPRRIEGFDVSHLDGRDTVASMVSFEDGRADRAGYRTFRIKHQAEGEVDDFEAMREVVARRYARVLNDGLMLPDLVLVDGGKGHVSAARKVLDALGLEELRVAGLAKKNEEVFLSDRSDPILLDPASPGLRVLIAVRNESHRFANRVRTRMGEKRLTTSVFEDVQGIGKRRAAKLIEAFGTPQGVLAYSAEEVAKRTGISLETAMTLFSHLEQRYSREAESAADRASPPGKSGVARRSRR